VAPLNNDTVFEKDRIVLSLLESVERDEGVTQRHMATELGVALGLVNVYLKRCVAKGFVKMRQVPKRRFVYYLTPRGFAEKSRLTVEYLSSSFSLFRQAKEQCYAALEAARANGCNRIVLFGASDLAEIAIICAVDSGTTIAAVVDPKSIMSKFSGLPLFASFDNADGAVDAVLVTHPGISRGQLDELADRFGRDHVFVPDLLGVRTIQDRGVKS
jgi:DNA-binding MarR family transcriptional regulator